MTDINLEESDKSVDLAETIHANIFKAKILLKRYWWIFIFTMSLGIGYQAYLEGQKETQYVSEARMIVSGRVQIKEGTDYSEELSNFFGTQIALMQSALVRTRAADRIKALRPELRPIFIKFVANQLPDTSIFLLRTEGVEPEYTRAYLDACLQEYIKFRKDMRSQSRNSTLLAIEEQLVELEQQIKDSENAVVEFKKQNNLVFLQEQGSSAGSMLGKLKNNMADLKTQLRMLDSLSLEQHLEVKSNDVGSEDEYLKVTVLDTSDNYKETKARLDLISAQKDEFSIYMKPRHPKIINFKTEIERAENLLNIYKKQGLDQLNNKRSVLKTEIENIGKVAGEWEVTALDYSRRLAEYDRLKSQLERFTLHHKRLRESIQSIEVGQNLEQEAIEILEPATPSRAITGQMGAKIAQGGIAGVVIGMGFIFLIGALDNRVMSAEDIKKRFDIPVLGILPLQSKTANGKVEVLKPKDSRHLFAEACRTLRSSILFSENNTKTPQVILVTSAVPEEGKSTISCNLASTLAFASAKTILIDADLRRGRIHRQFNLKNGKGLYGLLHDHTLPIDSVIQKTAIDNLHFIAAGEDVERPGEHLLSPRLVDIIAYMRANYEFVLFDSAPILATDDTMGFSAKADATIFTVRSNYTQLRQVKASVDRLMSRGTKLFGFVLNCVDTKGSDYYYYQKYYNYYIYTPKTGKK